MSLPNGIQIKGTVTLHWGLADVKCKGCDEFGHYEGHIDEVPALILGDNVIWTAPVGTYFDSHGDGGPTAEDVVAEHLKFILS